MLARHVVDDRHRETEVHAGTGPQNGRRRMPERRAGPLPTAYQEQRREQREEDADAALGLQDRLGHAIGPSQLESILRAPVADDGVRVGEGHPGELDDRAQDGRGSDEGPVADASQTAVGEAQDEVAEPDQVEVLGSDAQREHRALTGLRQAWEEPQEADCDHGRTEIARGFL
jgi:hypothetical protein